MTIDPKRDYCAILGVSPAAEDVVIKAAYKALMQRYHPDRASSSKEDTTEKVAEINEAYTILSNAKTRNEYDKLRAAETHSASDAFGVTDTARTENQAPKRAPHGKSKVRADYKNTGNYAWVLIFGAAVLWKASQTNIEYAIAYITYCFLMGAASAFVLWVFIDKKRISWPLSAWPNRASYGMIAFLLAGFLIQQGAEGLINKYVPQIAQQSPHNQSSTRLRSLDPNKHAPQITDQPHLNRSSTGIKPIVLDPNVDYLFQTATDTPVPEWRKGSASFEKETSALGSGLYALGAQTLGAAEARDEALNNYHQKMEEVQSGWMAPN